MFKESDVESREVIGYSVYRYWPDRSGSDYIFTFNKLEHAVHELGVILGQGGEGYMNRVVRVVAIAEESFNPLL